MKEIEKLKDAPIPAHVGIIMDGNGRWAQQRGLSRSEGHRAGADVIEPLLDSAEKIGIRAISLYAFSVENWTRPVGEIKGIWELLEYLFKQKLAKIKERNVKIICSGSLRKLPGTTRKVIEKAVLETEKNKGIILNFCINYGGRQEIVHAVNEWLANRGPSEKLTPKKLERHLYTKSLPPLDLIIRTSGEVRISNFLLWQSAYAEFVFTDVLWPDFNEESFFYSIGEFQKRKRRYGGI